MQSLTPYIVAGAGPSHSEAFYTTGEPVMDNMRFHVHDLYNLDAQQQADILGSSQLQDAPPIDSQVPPHTQTPVPHRQREVRAPNRYSGSWEGHKRQRRPRGG